MAQYLIEGHLGQGGMGEVFAAFDERLERRVALKFLPAERELDLVARGRMLREARAASALKHPGIVTIYEIGESEGRAFIAMELVEGEPLARLAGRPAPLPPAEAVALVRQIGDALAVAHEAGILHRDVKTANLMIDARGHVKVLDFGLSKRLPGIGNPASSPPTPAPTAADLPVTEADHEGEGGPVDPSAPTALPESFPPPPPPSPSPTPGRALQSSDPVTVHGARMGTPGSAAIELMRGEEADRRSDVFSLGVVLYELLCGRRPFRGDDLRSLIDAVASERYAPASTINKAVDARLDAVVARALRAPREERFATIAEMVAAAEAAVGVRASKPRRSRAVVAAVAGTVIGLGGGAALVSMSGSRGGGAKVPAEKAATAANVPPDPGRAAGPPRALTTQGGCAYSPTFADAATVVYDYTDAAGANHLWSVPLAGGAPKQLTFGDLIELRPMSGRHSGEVVYLVKNPASNTGERAGIAVLDLASGKSEMLSPQIAASAGFVDDELHYVRRDGSELRRVRDGVDESAARWKDTNTGKLMAVSHDGTHITLSGVRGELPSICVLGVDQELTCLDHTARVAPGRPVFSSDDRSVYYAGMNGIGRIRVDDTDNSVIVQDALAVGGVTLSPDGSKLVYSDCNAHGALFDESATPPMRLSESERVSHPTAGPDGRIAFVVSKNGAQSILLRERDGQVRQLAGPYDGKVTQPRFSADGKHIAYFVSGIGLHVLGLAGTQMLQPNVIATGNTEEDPAWLADGRLAFTRRTGPNAGSQVIDLAGGEPAPLAKIPRRVVGTLANAHVLLLSIDAQQFVEWDVKKQKESPARLSLETLGRIIGAWVSPDGRWLAVQAGGTGQRIYRYDLEQAHPQPELAFEARQGQTLGAVAITDEGHVLAAPQVWSGELHVVDAARGTKF